MVSYHIVSCILLIIFILFTDCEDRLQEFYDRINKSDVTYCSDRTKLLPDCTQCIPGLEKVGSALSSSSSSSSSTSLSLLDQPCSRFIKSSISIRNEIKRLTEERYAGKIIVNRPYGLYPCKL